MFDQVSIKYLEKSLVVIPLDGKKPILNSWQKLTHTSLVLQNEYPNKNIGILLGKINNIVAIDIDKDDAKTICPVSPIVKKGLKGETRFFRYNNEPAIKRHDLGIEILSDGNQTVLPPSIHPENKQPYIWLYGDDLLSFDIEDLPVIPLEFLNILKSNRPKQMSEGRHNNLVSLMGTCISQFMDKEQSVKHCFEHDQIHHSPPYYTDRSEIHGGKGLEIAAKMYESVKQTAIDNGEFIDPEAIKNIVIDFKVENIDTYIKPKYAKFPKLIGVGQLLFEDIYHNAYVPRTQFSFMATVQILSHIIGNKLSFMGNCANLYQYGLADSGFGKDFPYRRVVDYLMAVDKKILASNSPTSESIVLLQIETNRERLFMINEAESLIKRMTNNQTNHSLKECLTDLYDMPMKLLNSKQVLNGKGKKTDEYASVFSPYIGMFLMSTQTGFEDCVNNTMFDTGFLSRFLLYFEDRFKKAKLNYNRKQNIDSNIVDQLKLLYEHSKPIIADLSDSFSGLILTPANDAKEFYEHLFNEIEVEKEKAYQNTKFMGLLNRKIQFINKFTIIHHVMKNHINYHNKVEKDSIIWANAAITAIINNMIINLDKHVHNSEYEKESMKFLEYIRISEKQGRTKKQISANFRKFPKKTRDVILNDLIDQEKITKSENNKYYCI